MTSARPHFLLHAETYRPGRGTRRWKFTLKSVSDSERLSATDTESDSRRDRLELLAVVRGLEALNCPTRVTLLTRSRYVSRGIRRQLAQWREHHWQWERFGTVKPIRDYDLWRRIDRALEFHTVECCVWQADEMQTDHVKHSTNDIHSTISLPATLAKLGRGVLTPLTYLWRPSFTRAA